MTASLFTTNDSVNDIIFKSSSSEAPLQRIPSAATIDMNVLQSLGDVSFNSKQSFTNTILCMPKSTEGRNQESCTAEETQTQETETTIDLKPPAPLSSSTGTAESESTKFLQSMMMIMAGSKPTKPIASASPSRGDSRKKRDLEEITSSRTWNNLGTHEDINMIDVFCTKQDNSFEQEEEHDDDVPEIKTEPKVVAVPVVQAPKSKPTTPAASKSGRVYYEPRDNDVLLGRGGRTNHHPGNKAYLALKDSMQERYMSAEKSDKTNISQELVDIINNDYKGRFLKLDQVTQRWYEIDNDSARKKCSQSLREVNTPEVRAQKRARYPK